MKISKAELKQIISEELEVVLTNEEVREMFGEDVHQHLEGSEGEGSMAVKQINNIGLMTGELLDLIDDSDNLDEWVEAKITKAHDYLNTVLNHLSAEGIDPNFNPLMESPESDAAFEAFDAALEKLRTLAHDLPPEHLELLSIQTSQMADELEAEAPPEEKGPREPPPDDDDDLAIRLPPVTRSSFDKMKSRARQRHNPRLKYSMGEQKK